MVNVENKLSTHRSAVAQAIVSVNEETMMLIKSHALKKGDVLTVAQIAGILGAKQVANLIPLCHPIKIDNVELNLELLPSLNHIKIKAKVNSFSRTGVEMEALTAVSIAALTVYDMCKAADPRIIIHEIKLLSKKGGKKDFDCND